MRFETCQTLTNLNSHMVPMVGEVQELASHFLLSEGKQFLFTKETPTEAERCQAALATPIIISMSKTWSYSSEHQLRAQMCWL